MNGISRFLLAGSLFSLLPLVSAAQPAIHSASAEFLLAESAMPVLPDSPGFVRSAALKVPAENESTLDAADGAPVVKTNVAEKHARIIQPGQQAQPLTPGDKLIFSIHNQTRPMSPVNWVVSAGLSHLRDGRPHYGTDSGAFGERLGAAALKQGTQSILVFGVFASLFHEDPRYYRQGNSHPFMKRAVYAASRIVITRTDSGQPSINWARICGMAGSAAMTNLYYPERDTGLNPTLRSYGDSFVTGAATNELREFMADAIAMIRRKR
ncbi:hypothetical protein FTW19_11045 [Terriglobus albidus]|uniref:Uncharacterized protein n=2 Tax=Terriglobus albidus TaxID=1592106 RepID=A0A5B9E8P8_9BACT|nr:hypothetical protein FTW19_11045 [Terriglobus albidus]